LAVSLKYLGIPPGYEFEFEETTNPGTTWVYNNGTSRKLLLSNVTPALQIGKFYNVRERAVVNGISYCYGDPCVVGITGAMANPNQAERNSNIAGNIEIGVYPNPSNDYFNVNILTGSENQTEVRLMDMSGRTIEKIQLNNGEKNCSDG